MAPVDPDGPPPRVRFQPANPVETELLRAADEESVVLALAGAELLLPVPAGTDPGARPSRPDFPWVPGDIAGTPAVPAFTSPERLQDVIGQVDFVRAPFALVVRHWPDAAWTLAVNPGTPVSATLAGAQLPLVSAVVDEANGRAEGFTPQNELEERMRDAAAQGDTDALLALLSSAQVMIPADPDTPWGARPGDPDFPWRPVPVKGEPAILAFTSPRWMHESVGQARFVMPDFRDLAANWPERGWSLVLDPGTPIALTVPGDGLRATTRPPVEEPRPVPVSFEPGNRVDKDLDEAVLAGDTDDFLRVTLSAEVLVPVPDTAQELAPEHPDFDWSAALSSTPPGPGASVRVFTSLPRLQETVGEARCVVVRFTDLIAHWRRPDWTLHLNPGSRIGASLTGPQVRELHAWAVSVGLHGDEPEPPQQTTTAQAPEEPVAAPREAEPSGGPQTTMMQKVLPHAQVGWYLDQSYDRVGGFVHPLADCAGLATPVQLYEALGLLYAGSPFSPSDESVHVLRWPAYCEDLYRVPFGGRTEDDLTSWGDAGWVVEHAPFTGDGFAAGSAGTIREYKADSARLPSGTELHLLGADGSARLVAVYDADVLAWTRPRGEEEAR
ncbi:SseB family protein [Actinocorallia sp. API 0066]|nr:SseB family protein [Actinocorallia sp. API 0066]